MMPFDKVGGNEWNIRCFLLNAELLEKLHLHIGVDRNLVELHDDILSSTSRTLKVLDLTVSLFSADETRNVFLGGICEELEVFAGHNLLEALSFKVLVDWRTSDKFIGSTIQKGAGQTWVVFVKKIFF